MLNILFNSNTESDVYKKESRNKKSFIILKYNQKVYYYCCCYYYCFRSMLLYIEANKEMDYWIFNYLSLVYEIENLFHSLSYLQDDNSFIIPDV